MTEIEFQPIAKDDIKEIYDYFSKYSVEYADSFIYGLYDYIEDLQKYPKLGMKYPDIELP